VSVGVRMFDLTRRGFPQIDNTVKVLVSVIWASASRYKLMYYDAIQ
jgi:hypothetical protein